MTVRRPPSTLLGPNGQPISSGIENKKAPQPITGNAFGQWAGRDVTFATLPGGGVVQFDLSKLTVADFRNMRDHYQVNASLSVLSFMQHQSDFHVESEDKKVAEFCDYQLHEQWTMLNRGLSQANWAGYSPMVLEWENDVPNRKTDLGKVKDLIPEECRVNWKEEEGWAPPGRTKPKFKKYDGIKQFPGTGWPIPVDNCVHPDTKILCADSVWRRAGDLEVGDEIVAFDEDEQPRGRRYKTAVIEVNNSMEKDCVTVTTDIGQPITMSVDHPCLVRRGAMLTGDRKTSKYKDHWIWIEAGELQPGDRIGYFSDPWDQQDGWDAGYIAGILDGEGSLSNGNLSFSQRSGWVLERTLDILDQYEFKYTVHENSRDDCKHVQIKGGMREHMRFMGLFNPERIGRNQKVYENVSIKLGKSADIATVQSVSDVFRSPIASIQTSTGTFITGGYLSHNTLWYPVLMENGDYYGRKLLRAAFQSWFFSLLTHLFANRYYERFGEPVPIGRAPFEDEITVDNRRIKGSQWMLSVLQDLRNRSVVVLPNDRDIDSNGRPMFDYDIEYLESQMRGADFERYMTRLDEEVSLALFTPILLMRTADVGSYDLGQGHMQLYLWMMNAFNADRAFYIDRYVLPRMVDYNFSVRAPRAKIKFEKLDRSNQEMRKEILIELVKADKASVDLEELGQGLGMTVKQVRQTAKPTEAPPADDPEPTEDDDTGSTGGGNNRVTLQTRKMTAARATSREIVARVSDQVNKAFRENKFTAGYQVNMGFRNRMSKSLEADGIEDSELATIRLFERMDAWLADVVALGAEEFTSSKEFVELFNQVLVNEIASLA